MSKAHRQTWRATTSRASIARQLVHAVSIVSMVASPVMAQVAPGGQNAPTMDMAANGTPVVRITTPNSAGVSHNTYDQFSVDGRGLILNNSGQIVSTSLAGYIDGNGNLKTSGPAKLILNEVVSANPSHLAGYMEVAGPAAQLVLANANGITCDGCGFINTPWATLAAGKAMFGPAGSLSGFAVDGGKLAVGGKGLDASGARLDLFARAIAINGGVWAERINASTGVGDIAIAGSDDPIVVTGRASNEVVAPAFALDVAAIGGMYARSIRLIGTEAGLGVRIDGTLASLEQGVTLDAAGHIGIGGKLVANTSATVTGGSDVAVSGTLYGAASASLSLAGTLANSGVIGSEGNIGLKAQAIGSSGTLAAGLEADGSLGTSGDVSLSASGAVQLGGQMIAPGSLILNAGKLDLEGAIQADRALMSATGAISQGAGATLNLTGNLGLTASSLINRGAVRSATAVLEVGALDNDAGIFATTGAQSWRITGGASSRGGTIETGGLLALNAGTLDLTGGRLVSTGTEGMTLNLTGALVASGAQIGGNGAVTIDASSITLGSGRIDASGALTIDARNTVSVAGGAIVGQTLDLHAGPLTLSANAQLGAISTANISAGDILFDASRLSVADLTLNASSLSLIHGSSLASSGVTLFALTLGDALDLKDGQIEVAARNAALTASTMSIGADGALRHYGAGALALNVGDLANAGTIAGNGNVELAVATLDNEGMVNAVGNQSLGVSSTLSNAGQLLANGKMTITGGALSGAGTVSGGQGLTMNALSISMDGSKLLAGDFSKAGDASALKAVATGTISLRGALAAATGTASLKGSTLDAGAGRSTGQDVSLIATSGDLRLTGGTVDGQTIDLSVAGTIDASQGGLIHGHAVTLNAAGLDTSVGRLITQSLDATLGKLTNRAGTISLQGATPASITLSGALDNTGGRIEVAADSFSLSAATITNNAGALVHAGAGLAKITATGSFDNGGGSILSNGGQTIAAAAFNNSAGDVQAAGATTFSISGTLNNSGGSIRADEDLSLSAAGLDNRGGTIGTLGALTQFTAASLDNRGGVVTATGDATLALGSLVNGGELSAGKGMDATIAASADNAGGVITAERIGLSAPSFTNSDGRVLAGTGGADLHVADQFDNSLGKVGAVGALILRGNNLINGGTISASGTDGLILELTGSIDNRGGGALWSDTDLKLSGAALTNAGSIAANDDVTLNVASIANGAGVIGAGHDLKISFDSLDPGKLVAGNLLDLTASGDWTLASGASLIADHALKLTLGGALRNEGKITAATSATISAASLSNAPTGTIEAGTLDASVTGALHNAGLINGSSVTLAAASLHNIARIYGDSITIAVGAAPITINPNDSVFEDGTGISDPSIIITEPEDDPDDDGSGDPSTGTDSDDSDVGGQTGDGRANIGGRELGDGKVTSAALWNDGARAVIATRSGSIVLRSNGGIANTDGALIYSSGNIAIGGTSPGSRAGALVNSSARIEAQGDIAIAATSLRNVRTLFTVQDTILSQTPVSVENKFNKRNRDLLQYTRTIAESEIIADSGEAAILGSNIQLDFGTADNVISLISANGVLDASGGSVTNQAYTGQHTDLSEGATYHQGRSCPIFGCKAWKTNSIDPYKVKDETATFTVSAIAAGNQGVEIAAKAIDNRNLTTSGSAAGDYVASAGSAQQSILGAATSSTLNASATTNAVSGEGAVRTSLFSGAPVGTGSLGSIAPVLPTLSIRLIGLFDYAAPGSSYLIETDPKFIDYKAFVSSDYFFDRLGWDPVRVGQRLGDAWYEQQYVAQQLTQLTGRNRLGDYRTAEDQYKALMSAGAATVQAFGLAPGIGLSAQQMATLTSDIVIMVMVEVDTPTGKAQVLAPIVYLTHVREGDLRSSGALIAGDTVTIRTSDSLANAGVIRATLNSDIGAGTSLTNSGRIAGGKTATITAGTDIVSRGGVFTGGDLTLSAGRNIDLGAQAVTTHVATGYSGNSTLGTITSHQVSIVDATGSLKMVALGDISSAGAQIDAGTTASLAAGGNVTLGSVTDSVDKNSFLRIRNGYTQSSSHDETVVGTSVSAAGDISIAAGLIDPTAKLTLSASSVTSETGAVALSGTGGVEIGTANEHDAADSLTKTKKSGMLSSTRTTTTSSYTSDTSVGSTVSGSSVSVTSSAGNIAVTGSNVVADKDVALTARGDITIAAVENRESESSATSVKKSGFSVGGGGVFVGVAKVANQNSSESLTHTGSLVGSSQGNVSITAGGGIKVAGSDVVSAGTTSLTGKSIMVEHVTDTLDTTSASKSSSFGLSIGAYENISGAVKSVAGLPGRVADGGAGAAGTAITGVSEGLRTLDAVRTLATNAAGISVSLGFSKSSSSTQTQTEIVSGSSVSGQNVVLKAEDDIRVAGSTLKAANDLTLDAGRDIVLESGQNSLTSQSQAKSSGGGIGLSVGVGLAGGVTASGSISYSQSRSSGQSSAIEQVNSQLGAGGTLSLSSGRDTTLAGAVATGRDVSVETGRDLIVESRQDITASSSKSSGFGVSLSSFGNNAGQSGTGGSASVSYGKGSASSALVAQQSGLMAQGGVLDIDVAGNTSLTGGVLAAVDGSGADSGKLSLQTGTLAVADIADHADSRSISIGLSGAVNDPLKADGGKLGAPTIDGAFANSTIRQETRGTIGQGTVSVASPQGGTALADVNRDLSATQVVTKDSQSGATLYASETSIREGIGLAAGDRSQSAILATADKLATDPLAIVKAVVGEAKSLGDGKQRSGALETLVDKVDSMVPGYAHRQVQEQIERAPAAIQSAGLTPEQTAATVERMTAEGVFERSGELEQAYTDLGRSLPLPPEKVAAVKSAIREFVARGNTSPEAQATFKQQMSEITGEDIVVIGRRETPMGRVTHLAVQTSEKLGSAYNNAPDWMKKGIAAATTVMGGLSGIVSGVVLEVSGAGALIEKGKEVIVVGGDALLRDDSFSQVHAENQDKSADNPTYNQTTGIGIVADTALAAIVGGGVKGVVKGEVPALSKADFPEKVATISRQKQERHVNGGRDKDPDAGGEMASLSDAQAVLDAYHAGNATIVGKTVQGDPIVQVDGIVGINKNAGSGYDNQPTNIFIIKGTKSVSVVPTSPSKAQK
ncbi:hemagglutinin repeat-containing protein [Sphingobium sp. B12D2B]|uniref:two-partner secretion domain-containing protein n=1 Tax=Sphingobium sp. B12D2B TaxID=2940577 RepID=UPI0022241E62|nr:hemagglutinin repeat-containing protein [Sphingobium sp. B12D2B]